MMGSLSRILPAQFMLIVPATVLLYVVSFVVAPGSVSAGAMLTVLCFASILATTAIGQTLVVQQGGLDLSVPGVISLAAVLVTKFPAGDNAALALWTGAALASGVVSGLICGIAITRFYVTPLVATLAVNALLYGTVLYVTKGTSTEAVPSALSNFAVGRLFGVPQLALFTLAAVVLVEIGVRWVGNGAALRGRGRQRTSCARGRHPRRRFQDCDICDRRIFLRSRGRPSGELSPSSKPARRPQLSAADHHRCRARRQFPSRRRGAAWPRLRSAQSSLCSCNRS